MLALSILVYRIIELLQRSAPLYSTLLVYSARDWVCLADDEPTPVVVALRGIVNFL
jgi:hypothetical protein